MLSILTPAFNESPNLAALHARLAAAMERLGVEDWEWIVVDDHSRDDTLQEVERIALERSPGAWGAPVPELGLAPGDCLWPAPGPRRRRGDDGGRPAGSARDHRGDAGGVAEGRPDRLGHAARAAGGARPRRLRRALLLDHAAGGRHDGDAGARSRLLPDRPGGHRRVHALRRAQRQRARAHHLARDSGRPTSNTTSSRARPAGRAGPCRARSRWWSTR